MGAARMAMRDRWEYEIDDLVVAGDAPHESAAAFLDEDPSQPCINVNHKPKGRDGGQFAKKGSPSGGAQTTEKLNRGDKAAKFHKASTAEKQQYCEANELLLQKTLGFPNTTRTTDGSTMDLIFQGTFKGKLVLHGVEVKTMVDNKNQKITMHPGSRRKKEFWADGYDYAYAKNADGSYKRNPPTKVQIERARKKGVKPVGDKILIRGKKTDVAYKGSKKEGVAPVVSKLTRVVHMIAYDNMDTFKGGANKAYFSGHNMYYARKMGAWNVTSPHMVRVKSPAHLRKLIKGEVDH